MSHIRKELVVKNAQGLHARPSALFVQISSKYNSNITVQKGNEKVNGKSIMGLLTLGAQKDSKIIVEADGIDAEKVMVELEALLMKDQL